MTNLTRKMRSLIAVLGTCAILSGCLMNDEVQPLEEDIAGGDPNGSPANNMPVANAGPDKTATVGDRVTLSGRGSDPDGDQLTYIWSVVTSPANRAVEFSGANGPTPRFSPELDGLYEFSLAVSDSTVTSKPDNVRVTVNAAPVDGETPPANKTPPMADSYAATAITLSDDFDDGLITSSNGNAIRWKSHTVAKTTIEERNSKLVIAIGGIADDVAYVQSDLRSELNFFNQPIKFSLVGIEFGGTSDIANQKTFQFALSSTVESQFRSPDVLMLAVYGDGRITLRWKTDSRDMNPMNGRIIFDRKLPLAPTRIDLAIDQSSYQLVAELSGESVKISGYHDIPKSKWGTRGDSAISIAGKRNASTADDSTVHLRLDALAVNSLSLHDEFSNDDPAHTGGILGYWETYESADANVSEESDGLVISADQGATNAEAGVFSGTTRQFNFFSQRLKITGRLQIDKALQSNDTATFSLQSTAQSNRRTPNALVLAIGKNGRLRLGKKINSPNSGLNSLAEMVDTNLTMPATSFELVLDKYTYDLKVTWSGGSAQYSGQHEIDVENWSDTGDSAIGLSGYGSSSAADDGTIVRWDSITVMRDQPAYVASTNYGPVGDGFSLEVPSLPAEHTQAKWGILDVTKNPFNADRSGVDDATQAIRHALKFAQQHQLVAYFPLGTYKISDTIDCDQGLYIRTNDVLIGVREEGPCVLIGERGGSARAKILLAANSAGFDDPENPKEAVRLWARSYRSDPEIDQPNTSINQMLINLDVEIGPGNSGAIGIQLQGAQGSGVQESTIDATHGFVGIRGGAGSGGSHADVTVIGGHYGLDLTSSQPNPTIVGITLRRQTESAIYYRGTQTLTAVGIKIVASDALRGPAIHVPEMTSDTSAVTGQIALIDSQIEFQRFGTSNTAISTGRSIYLKNVFVKNANTIVNVAGSNLRQVNRDTWSRVIEYADGVRPPAYSNDAAAVQYEMPLYIDGTRTNKAVVDISQSSVAPPPDLQAQHLWGANFPSWESAGAVNVKKAPYNAKGDGITDDFSAIQQAVNENEIVFLPKGQYKTSKPIQLRGNTKLIGIARHLSNIVAADAPSFADANTPNPVLMTPNNAGATTIVAFLGVQAPIDLPGAYSVLWQSGRNSLLRDVNIDSRSAFGYGWRTGKPNPDDTNAPLVVISGNGGGKWYNFYQESAWKQGPGYRHLLIDGTTAPLRFYQLNAEHAQSDANVEIRSAANVDIYGFKSEGNFAILWVRDSDYINVFGFGGNAAPFAASLGYPQNFAQFTPSLFRIERTPNIRLVNIIDNGRAIGDHPVFGQGVDANLWHAIYDSQPNNPVLLSRILDRPVLYQRGFAK